MDHLEAYCAKRRYVHPFRTIDKSRDAGVVRRTGKAPREQGYARLAGVPQWVFTHGMPKYVILFGVNPETLGRFIDRPEDRRGPVNAIAQAVGGRLESYYWMFGHYDGLAIFDLPDSESAAAVALAAASTGAFRQVETHELIEAENLPRVLERAKQARPSYRPPGGG